MLEEKKIVCQDNLCILYMYVIYVTYISLILIYIRHLFWYTPSISFQFVLMLQVSVDSSGSEDSRLIWVWSRFLPWVSLPDHTAGWSLVPPLTTTQSYVRSPTARSYSPAVKTCSRDTYACRQNQTVQTTSWGDFWHSQD